MKRLVTTYYLEMTRREDLCPSGVSVNKFEIRQACIPSPDISRFFYTTIGRDWFWIDRLNWTYQQWYDYLNRPEIETWLGYLSGTPAGYFELELQESVDAELVYFGLLPQFIGQGIGGILLTKAVERAWQIGAKRVWVHTCTLDGPTALGNYQARGFRIYREVIEEKMLPEKTPGPWPSAQ